MDGHGHPAVTRKPEECAEVIVEVKRGAHFHHEVRFLACSLEPVRRPGRDHELVSRSDGLRLAGDVQGEAPRDACERLLLSGMNVLANEAARTDEEVRLE
jgi:hypothetical protein